MDTNEALKKLNIQQKTGPVEEDTIKKSFVDSDGEEKQLKVKKGIVVDSFSHDKDFKIFKTGKQLKIALERVKSEQQSVKDKCNIEMSQILKQVTYPPVEEFDEYSFHGVRSKMTYIPKRYDWDRFLNEKESYGVTMSTLVSGNVVDKKDWKVPEDEKALCRKYNDEGYKYLSASVDIVMLDTIIESLEDNKKYSLSIKQAAMINF